MIQILGRYLTPLLLLCLAAIIGVGSLGYSPAATGLDASDLFSRGLLEGYNTMDLIAAFFFTASIIQVYCGGEGTMRRRLGLIFRASIVGVVLLGSVYVGLVYLASLHGPALAGVPKEQLLAEVAKLALGSQLGVVAAIAICLACLTTSVALTSVYADFISHTVFSVERRLASAVVGTQLVIFGMSLAGLAGITAVTAPALQVCYPILILLVLVHALRGAIQRVFGGSTQDLPVID
jgi:LIVCS family branched-chain amino acid:cation transporter